MSLKSLIQKMDELSDTKQVLNESSNAEYQAKKTAKTASQRQKNITAASRELQDVMIGKLPKEKPGASSVTHKTPDFDVSDDDEELKEGLRLPRYEYGKVSQAYKLAKQWLAIHGNNGYDYFDYPEYAGMPKQISNNLSSDEVDFIQKYWPSQDVAKGSDELETDDPIKNRDSIMKSIAKLSDLSKYGKEGVEEDQIDEMKLRNIIPGLGKHIAKSRSQSQRDQARLAGMDARADGHPEPRFAGDYPENTPFDDVRRERDRHHQRADRYDRIAQGKSLFAKEGVAEGKYDPAKDTFNPETHTAITKDGVDKIIPKSQLPKYKEQGWKERHSLKAFHTNREKHGVAEGLDPEQQGRLDELIDDYNLSMKERAYWEADAILDKIKREFGKDIADKVDKDQGVAEATIPTSLAGWMNLVEGKTVSEEVVKAPVPVQQNGQSELATLTSTSSDPADANVLKAAAEILKRGQGQIQLPKSTQQSSSQGTTSTSQAKAPTTSAGAANQPQQMSEEELDEVAAPGQEDWIKKNKQRFIDQYGKKKGLSVLYATAWKRSKDTTESVEKDGDQSSEKTQSDPWKHVDDRVDNPVIKGTNQRAKTGVFPPLKKVERLKEPYLKENNDSEKIMNQNKQQIMEGYTLEDIEAHHPHEVKMCQEGWGLDESLYEALADYYFREGKIPRKIWHGSLDELRDFVLDCYLKDKSPLLGEQSFTQASPGDSQFGPVPEAEELDEIAPIVPALAGAAVRGAAMGVGKAAADTLFGNDEDEVIQDDISDNEMVDISDDDLDSGEFPFPDMEDELEMSPDDEEDMEQDDLLDEVDYMEEEIMYESKMKKHKRGMAEEKKETKTGVIHKAEAGGYGRKDDEDDEGKKVKKDTPKRGRGRPKKDADSETGEVKKWDTDELARWIVGSKPKTLPGKASVKHKLKDESVKKKDAQMESWNRQLQQLLNEGMTVTTSTGQNGMGDSVSVSATDEDAQELMKVLQSAGIGMGSGMRGASEPHSHEGQQISVEPASSDEVMGQLQPEEDGGDNALGFIKKMIGLRGGDTSQVDAAHGDGDYEEEDHDHDDEDSDEEQVVMVGEEDVEEGNKFTGELAKARKDGVQKGETMKVDGKEYPVKPGKKEVEEATNFLPGWNIRHDGAEPQEHDPSENNYAQRGKGIRFSRSGRFTMTVHGNDIDGQIDIYDASKRELDAQTSFRYESSETGYDVYDENDNPVNLGRVNSLRQLMNKLARFIDKRYALGHDPSGEEEMYENTDKEMCSECGGAMYEGHACGQEKLDEWANSPMGKSADEQFQTELDYMTKLISGGLNRMKQDQTTLPHTKVKTDIAEDNIKAMKKLAGI